MCETERLECYSLEKLTVNLPATELQRHLQHSHRHSRAHGVSCQQPQLPNILWMWHQGHSLYLTHRGTHHHVFKGAPRLAAFLHALCHVNKTNKDIICFTLVTTTTLIFLTHCQQAGTRNLLHLKASSPRG